MRLLQLLSFTIILLFSSLTLKAQYHEAGVFGGASLFSGDVIENVVDFNEISLGFGAFYKHYTSPKFSFKVGVHAGRFTGDDANSSSLSSRGLSFQTDVLDLNVTAEWNIFGLNIYGPTAKVQNRFSPFFLLGAGASYFKPEVSVSNPDKPLNPYDATIEYPKISMVVPMGMGLKYMTNSLTFTVEGTLRAGLTDLIDGISKSGDPSDNDWYGMYGVSIAYRIGERRSSSAPKEIMEETETEYYEGTNEEIDENEELEN